MLGGDPASTATPSAPADATATAATTAHEGGSGGGGLGTTSLSSTEEDKSTSTRAEQGDLLMGYNTANRWPRQETLALLKIRSDMDAVFRDSSHKGALWEEVSRKLADLGYHRTPKKCKEKFENVYKYHKRTKEGRTGKSEGKTYRYFDQLEAFEKVQSPTSHSPIPSPTPLSSRPPMSLPPAPLNSLPDQMAATTTVTLQWSNNPTHVSHVTVPSTTSPIPPQNLVPTNIVTNIPAFAPLSTPATHNIYTSSFQNVSTSLFSSSTSSSTASDEGLGGESRKRKRKWKGFFQRLAKDVVRKQEELQKRFLEALERHERERIVREEAWRAQEMVRINKEHEVLIQERSAAAAKDAAIISFLQKMSGQEGTGQMHISPIPPPVLAAPPQPPPPPRAQTKPPSPQAVNVANMELDIPRRDSTGDSVVNVGTSSSRWPKAEVYALIRLRKNLDVKYQQNGPKGPLWEEISSGMMKLGYSRSAKRCKEKWENINKYFKKVKESSKKRPEDSKTCPYFHMLDALYKEKSKGIDQGNPMEPLMARPEQQWPPPGPVQAPVPDQPPVAGTRESMQEDDDEELEGEIEEEEEEEEEEDGGFEVVPNKGVPAPLGNGE